MKHLTQKQRYTIEAMHKQRHAQTAIATAIGKHTSVISRELKRNCGQRSKCYSELADVVLALLMPLKHLSHAITADNGKEFAAHEKNSQRLRH